MDRRLMSSLIAGAAALLGAAAVQAAPQYGYDGYGGQVIRCESPDNRYRECAIDTRGGVELTRQLSRTRCVEGHTWGYGRGGIWVDRGCRGEFRSRGGGWGGGGGWSGNGQRIRCESDNGRTRTCPIPSRGQVRLVRKLSKADCSEGYSWGRDRNAIWVSRGCRAEFEVHGGGQWGGGGWDGGGYGRTFRCESDNGRDRYCQADGRRVELVRQLSRAPCVEGRTWGRDRRGVWVTGGCRAEFRSW